MSDPALLPSAGHGSERVRMVVFDFDGVFTDNTVSTDSNGVESVRSWRGDGLGLEKLRVPFRQGLTDKGEALAGLAAELGIPVAEVAYVGNDINDAACLRLVGTPIVVADAHAEVMSLARYRTKAQGGLGAVREVCDWLAGESRPTP